jgi:hypothetical protein
MVGVNFVRLKWAAVAQAAETTDVRDSDAQCAVRVWARKGSNTRSRVQQLAIMIGVRHHMSSGRVSPAGKSKTSKETIQVEHHVSRLQYYIPLLQKQGR